MPLIDLKSNLADYRKTASSNLNTVASAVESHASRLLDLLLSPRGVIFAAKQKALDPQNANQRLAQIFKQVTIGLLPGVHFKSTVLNKYTVPNSTTGAEVRRLPKGVEFREENNYYYSKDVSSKVDLALFVDGDTLSELDIIPFYFTTYKLSDGQVTMSDSLAFRSFFSNIQDSVTGNWSSFTYTGRGEQFYVYGSRARTASFNFKVAAFNKQQLSVIHNKVKVLQSFAAPTYNTNGYMEGNFLKLTIGDYFKNVPGILTSVNVSITNEFVWEVQDRTQLLPHVLDISVQFTVLEDKTPQVLTSNDF